MAKKRHMSEETRKKIGAAIRAAHAKKHVNEGAVRVVNAEAARVVEAKATKVTADIRVMEVLGAALTIARGSAVMGTPASKIVEFFTHVVKTLE
jgi:hypothetical protein